jgi:TDG/mug DNA glycosylase family protein
MDQDYAASFDMIVNDETRILILGAVPGRASLAVGEYYAHKRNAFWHIMKIYASQKNIVMGDDYQSRIQILLAMNIGLWDVINNCSRVGSLDKNIKNPKLQNFEIFFEKYPRIEKILLNGAGAYDNFIKVTKSMNLDSKQIVKMPSTSPANAQMSLQDKCDLWLAVLQS